MLLAIKFAAKILAALNGEVSPRQIAAGFAAGVWIGLIPLNGALPTLLLLFFFMVNVNLTLLFVAAAITKIFSFLVDPLSNVIGHALLVSASGLHGLWTKLYNTPLVPYTNFNNTNVMGSLVLGLLLLIPLYFVGQWGVVAYRNSWRQKIMKWKVVQVFKASTLYRFYETYQGIRGE